jgi:hypothetical protein
MYPPLLSFHTRRVSDPVVAVRCCQGYGLGSGCSKDLPDDAATKHWKSSPDVCPFDWLGDFD